MVIGVWSLAEQSIERITVSLSRIAACLGKCSQNRTPGTRVAIEPNGPRIWAGASGLGSHMSRWLGPPESQKRITDFRSEADPAGAAARLSACIWSNPAVETPARPPRPAWRNQRLVAEPTRIRSCSGGCQTAARAWASR